MRQVFLGASLLLIFILAACNLPGAAPSSTSPEIMTSAAMTVDAAIKAASSATAIPDSASQASATPTFSRPAIQVDDVVNCRQGPGTNYSRVTQLVPDQPVDILGYYAENYWLVSTSAGECWVDGQFATPVGSYQAVPTVTVPPTPTGNAPEGVILQKWNIFCNFQTGLADISLQWSDRENAETGYRIIRNEVIVAELPANSTSFVESINLLDGQSVSYRVEVFSPLGSASSSPLALSC